MAEYVTAEELQNELEVFGSEMGSLVKEGLDAVKESLGNTDVRVTNLEARMDKIDIVADDDIETLVEKVAKNKALLNEIESLLSENGELAKDLLNRIAANQAAIGQAISDLEAEVERAKNAESELQGNIDKISEAIASYKETVNGELTSLKERADNAESAISELQGRTDSLENAVGLLNADADTEGSVDYKIAQEESRTKAVTGVLDNLTTNEKGSLVKAINEVKADAVKNKNDLQKAIDDAMAAADELRDKDADLQKQIDEITGGESGSIKDLQDQVNKLDERVSDIQENDIAPLRTDMDEVKATLEDTTDENDNLVKGLKSRVSDLEGAVKTNAQATANAQASADAAMAEAQKAGLKTGVISGKKAFEAFKAAFLGE
jgi:chromosome segregation ATPase